MENWQKLCSMTAADIKKMQDRKLRALLVNQIYPYSPYYGQVFKEHWAWTLIKSKGWRIEGIPALHLQGRCGPHRRRTREAQGFCGAAR
jgi:hypothetical protein